MGQFRATKCPICGSLDITKWTCPPCTALVSLHRELIRNLQHWRSLFEAREVDEILTDNFGDEHSLWDIEKFYAGRTSVAPRMAQSIQHFLYENRLEKDAAKLMGVGKSNPVGVYATIGLTHMLVAATTTGLNGYRLTIEREVVA